jgi:acyl carrier protein
MVPSIFITLDSLPLTPTGKVDRRSLPAPQGKRPQLENPYVAPSSPLEETLVKIWAEVLGLEQVGVNDPFLELGGNSLLAMILASRVLKALNVQVPLRALFEAPTVAQMATVIIEILANRVGEEKLNQMFEEVLSQDDPPSPPSPESSLEKD